MKFLHVDQAEYIEDYKIKLRFNNGSEGIVDLENEIYGPIFQPLKDLSYFKAFRLEGHTLSWENGADFAPEYLEEKGIEQGGIRNAYPSPVFTSLA